MIVGDEDPRHGWMPAEARSLLLLSSMEGEAQGEARSLSFLTLDLDGASMLLHRAGGACQPQPAAGAVSLGIPPTIEGLEDACEFVGRNADPLVADLDYAPGLRWSGLYVHRD